MENLENLKYSEEHEWVKLEKGKAYVGISDYAQDKLGDIVFVELPMEEEEFGVEDSLGVIESVKAVADIYAPLSGKIVEINEELYDSPELLNEAPYESWLVALELENESELEELMTAQEYQEFCLAEEE